MKKVMSEKTVSNIFEKANKAFEKVAPGYTLVPQLRGKTSSLLTTVGKHGKIKVGSENSTPIFVSIGEEREIATLKLVNDFKVIKAMSQGINPVQTGSSKKSHTFIKWENQIENRLSDSEVKSLQDITVLLGEYLEDEKPEGDKPSKAKKITIYGYNNKTDKEFPLSVNESDVEYLISTGLFYMERTSK